MQTNKLTKLIEDLLELSRVQSGRLTMERTVFAFDELVKEVVEDAKLTSPHAIIIKGHTKKKVKGDRERIGQVITNYLTNAIKYSPKTENVIISLKVRGKFLIVAVQDFGIGIAKEYHERVFDRFFRVTGADEKTYPGMGIGLHVCQEIIARHGGKTWVESKRKSGSTFYFSLPFVTKT